MSRLLFVFNLEPEPFGEEVNLHSWGSFVNGLIGKVFNWPFFGGGDWRVGRILVTTRSEFDCFYPSFRWLRTCVICRVMSRQPSPARYTSHLTNNCRSLRAKQPLGAKNRKLRNYRPRLLSQITRKWKESCEEKGESYLRDGAEYSCSIELDGRLVFCAAAFKSGRTRRLGGINLINRRRRRRSSKYTLSRFRL